MNLRTRLKAIESTHEKRHPEARASWLEAYRVYRHYADGIPCDLSPEYQVWALLDVEDVPILPALNLPVDRIRLLASTLRTMLLHNNAVHAYELLQEGRELDAQEAERFQPRDGHTVEDLVSEAEQEACRYMNRISDVRDGTGGKATRIELQAFALWWAWLVDAQPELQERVTV